MKRFIVLFFIAAAVFTFYLLDTVALAASPEGFNGGEPTTSLEAVAVEEKGSEAISNDTFITSLLYVLIIVSVIILIAIGIIIIVIFVSSLQANDQIKILAESSQELSSKIDGIKKAATAPKPEVGGNTRDTAQLINAVSANLWKLDRIIAKLSKSETEYDKTVASSLLKYEWDIIEQILKEQMNETRADINNLVDRFEALDKYLVGNRTASIAEDIESLTISMSVWQDHNKILEDRRSDAEAKVKPG